MKSHTIRGYEIIEAMSKDKESYSKDEAYRMIITGECGVFSPKLIEVFRNSKKEFEDLY